jgi:hypothetical protein
VARTPPTPEELLHAFGASDLDLELNQQGRLGPGQKWRIWRLVALNVGVTLLFIAGLAAIMLFAADRPIQWWRWLMVAVLTLILLWIGGRWSAKLVVSIFDGTVDCHSGPVHVFIAGSTGKQLTVKQITYNLTVPLNKVVDGAGYDVYVVERPAIVVAMVPLAPPAVPYGS